MSTYTSAVIGAGFIGHAHVEALRRLGSVDIRAIADAQLPAAQKLAQEFGIGRAVADYTEVINDPAIQVVHVCTPNALHFPIAEAALKAGKHVLCEKPLAISAAEAQKLVALAAEKKLRNATCHNLRYYPLVQQMRRMCAAGELGEILVVQGTYSQDWLLYDTDWNWRIDQKANGASRTLADIGSHWCDMTEHVTGLRIQSVCAEVQTFHKNRKRPKGEIETFSGKMLKPEDYELVPITTEDFGSCLFHLGERARGAFTVSQVSAGRKNQLRIEIYGTLGSVTWDQERPNQLWIGNRNTNNQELLKDPSLLKSEARAFADYPGGHAEGYPDTFKQLFRRFYASVGSASAPLEYPQFSDGLRQLQILEAELESNTTRKWVDTPKA
ncbi:MAG TPA: Gfo/Idh/MocA family oxidoreductase [Terriglobales bacterium]|jgi:predicted dehydrogenase